MFIFLVELYEEMFAFALNLYFLIICNLIPNFNFTHSYFWLVFIRNRLRFKLIDYFLSYGKIIVLYFSFLDNFSLGGWGSPEKDWVFG